MSIRLLMPGWGPLDTLVKPGDTEVATEKPRRFRRAAQPAGVAPGADGAQDDSTELEGAA